MNADTTAMKVLTALQAHRLKPAGQNRWRCNSPFRSGSDSQAFSVIVHPDGEHGAYHDHVTGETGSLYELAKQLNVPVPEAGKAIETKRAYASLAEYAQAHGVPAEAFEAAGWKYSAHDETHKRPVITIPSATGLLLRFADGEKPAFKSPTGYKRCWYGLKRAVDIAQREQLPIVLCNGAPSVVAAQWHGVPACAVTSGETRLPDELATELRMAWAGEVLLAFDCDQTGKTTALAIRAQLGARATVVDMHLTDRGDLADFCRLHGAGAMDRLMELAAQQREVEKAAPDQETEGLALLAASIQDLEKARYGDEREQRAADLNALIARIKAEVERLDMQIARPTVRAFDALAHESVASIVEAAENPEMIRGLRSGLDRLDEAIGGFMPELYVIYGATGMGKSTLCASIVHGLLNSGPGLIVSTEISPKRMFYKLLARRCGVSTSDMETGVKPDQLVRVKQAAEEMRHMGCHILDGVAPTVAQVRAAFAQGQKEHGYEWLVVDSASRMSGQGDIYQRMVQIADGLQSMYLEFNVPVIATSQIGRDVAERGAGKRLPRLEDAYGGGKIEQNAGVVMGVYNHQYYVDRDLEKADEVMYPPNTVLVNMLKNRWRGLNAGAIRLGYIGGIGFYNAQTTQFSELIDRMKL